ncbi:hypothetical protein ACTA71_001744 [Dictyostelium dimigraforme]
METTSIIIYPCKIFQLTMECTVNSNNLSCLNSISVKLLGSTTSNYCTNGITINLGSFSFSSNCNGTTLTQLVISRILYNNMDLSYTELNCFEKTLETLSLNSISINVDSFGTENQPEIAETISLNNCTFSDGRFTSVGNSLPPKTGTLNIKNTKTSNLLNIDFLSIKNLNNFYIINFNSSDPYPTYENSITSSNFMISKITISISNIPSFSNLFVDNLELTIVGNSFSTSELANLGTMNNVSTLAFKTTTPLEYPNALGSSNNSIMVLSLVTPLLAYEPTGYALPKNLIGLYVFAGINFNVNKRLPFNNFPTTLKSLYIGPVGIDTFNQILPATIEIISLSNNSFGTQSLLPDFSYYTKLTKVILQSCGFNGPIPESYCLFESELYANNLNGSWPQCKVCYADENIGKFDSNPNLIQGTCYPGSIVPNLDYNNITNSLTLYGKNLGLYGPPINETNQSFLVGTPQSLYQYYWNETHFGPITDTIKIKLSTKFYTLATKYLRPTIEEITKSGNNFTFKGINFSYNTSDFIIKISGIQGSIGYCEFTNINCIFSDQIELGKSIKGTIQNIKSSEIIPFYLNTIDNTTSIQCNTDCNEPLGYGKCNLTVGTCKCVKEYTGYDCSLPNQYISSVSTVPTTGGFVNIWGWFGTLNSGITIKIGLKTCALISINSGFINCTLDPGSGTQSITLFQNGITYTGIDMFHYTELTYSCPKDCSNNGKCDTTTGQCKCYNGWGGYDCNSKSSSGGGGGDGTSSTTTSTSAPTSTTNEIPKSNTTINGTDGSTVFNNQQTTYEISILSLIETDFSNNIINTYNLSKKWMPANNTSTNIYKFTQTIQGSCIITYTIEEIKVARDYQWAGLDLTLDKDSIKISVSIKNYTFNSVLNNLQLRIESLVGDDNKNTKENNECNNKDTEVDTSEIDKNQLLNYVTISRNQKVLYGRFINRVISDSRQTFITTSIISDDNYNNNDDKQSVIIGLNLPHCTNECLIDPDFSVLVSSSYQECSSGSNKSDRASWVLPVAIVVPCVAAVVIAIIVAVLYRKNRLAFLVAKSKINDIRLSKKN